VVTLSTVTSGTVRLARPASTRPGPTSMKVVAPDADHPLDEVAVLLDRILEDDDVPARGMTRRSQLLPKGQDTFAPAGPFITTRDEIRDPHDLIVKSWLNGEPRQVSHTGRMSVTIPEILSHYSALGYSAGDVVSTGTVSGVAGFSPDAASLYLKPGDVMEAEIERIGVLRNPVVSWEEAHGEPAPPRVRW